MALSQRARSFFTRPPTGTPRCAITPGEGLPRPRVAGAQEPIQSFISQLHLPNQHFLILPVSLGGVAEAALYCAHRASTSYRARSASKKGTWPLLLYPSQLLSPIPSTVL